MPEQMEQTPQPPQAPPAPSAGLTENATCGLAYVTFIPAIIFLATAPYNQNPKVKFHSWQSIALTVCAIVVQVALMIVDVVLAMVPGLIFITAPLGLLVWFGFFVLWLIVIINAFNGKTIKIPVIAPFAAKQSGYQG